MGIRRKQQSLAHVPPTGETPPPTFPLQLLPKPQHFIPPAHSLQPQVESRLLCPRAPWLLPGAPLLSVNRRDTTQPDPCWGPDPRSLLTPHGACRAARAHCRCRVSVRLPSQPLWPSPLRGSGADSFWGRSQSFAHSLPPPISPAVHSVPPAVLSAGRAACEAPCGDAPLSPQAPARWLGWP